MFSTYIKIVPMAIKTNEEIRDRPQHCLIAGVLALKILRQAWVNTDWLWSGTFVLAGIVTIFS